MLPRHDASAAETDSQAVARQQDRVAQFLAVLAHELRGPLAPISTGLELLRTTENNPAVVQEVHEIMQRQLNRLTWLIDDLFDLSCITRGVFSLKRRRTEIKSVVELAVEKIEPRANAEGHTLKVDLPREPLYLEGDPQRLVQALTGLLDNAVRFTPRGGTIRVAARLEADVVVLTVADNGVGIARAELGKIFGRLGEVGRHQPGLGMGLALARSLVELHGGLLEADSPGEGQGATFTMRLPIEDTQVKGPEQNEMLGLRVLVVDDNRAGADTLAMILETFGCEPLVAYDGEQGIRLAEMGRPDVVLLDISMPVIDGYEAAGRIRHQSRGREPVLIALTGWVQERDKEKAREAGFNHHVVKPVKAADLRAILAQVKRRSADSPR